MAKSVNPATLKVIGTYADFSEKKFDAKINKAHTAFLSWQKTGFVERKKLILKLAADLDKNSKTYARTITDEMGKVFYESVSEIKKCADTCKYFAENAEGFLKDIETASEYKSSFVTFSPLGVVLAVMPWNFPFWQVLRAAVPAIAAGNTVILKHASNVSGCALLIEDIFRKVGFPEGVFGTIIVPGDKVEKIISNNKIRAVTFTGSTEVGRKIAQACGRNLKKSVLELGGNDPYLVFSDANLGVSTEKCAKSRLINGGQSCISAKRFIINQKIYRKFLKSFTKLIKNAKFGDPYDIKNQIGPLVSIKARDDIHQLVEKYQRIGAAKLICGGFVPKIKGAYYPPTILEVIDAEKIDDVEIFGPVALVQKAKSDEEAIKIANSSNFGLGAAIFSKDIKRAEKLADKEVQSGCVFINDFVKSDPRFPFGGIKDSGWGRELSAFGIREFTNIKTVIVSKAS